jgi:hypothetical protein
MGRSPYICKQEGGLPQVAAWDISRAGKPGSDRSASPDYAYRQILRNYAADGRVTRMAVDGGPDLSKGVRLGFGDPRKPDPESLPDGDGDGGHEGESGGENEHESDDTE